MKTNFKIIMAASTVLNVALIISIVTNLPKQSETVNKKPENCSTSCQNCQKNQNSYDAKIAKLNKKIAELESNSSVVKPQSTSDAMVITSETDLETSGAISPEVKDKIAEMMNKISAKNIARSERQKNFLDSLLDGDLSEADRNSLMSLQKVLAKINELETEKAAFSPLSKEAMELTGQIMMEQMQSKKDLELARTLAINNFASDLGYQDDGVNDFKNYIDSVYDLTDSKKGGVFDMLEGVGGSMQVIGQ